MGTPNYWLGNAKAKNHTFTVTFATTATGTGTATVSNGGVGESFGYVSGNTVDIIAAGVFAALGNSNKPEIREITWSYPGTGGVITGTVTQAGVPAEPTASTTAATGTTVTVVDTVAPTGPNFINVAANFSLGLPTAAQDVIFASGPPALYGFASMGWGGTPDSVIQRATYTQAIGLPRYRQSGSGESYLEFRRRYFDPGCPLIVIGEGVGQGSSFISVALADNAHLRVYSTGSVGDETAAVNVVPIAARTPERIDVYGGSVSYGHGESIGATGVSVDAVRVDEGGRFIAGPSNTATLLTNAGGIVSAFGTTTALVTRGGTYTQYGGRIDAVSGNSGTVILNHTQSGANVILCQLEGNGIDDPPVVDVSQTLLVKTFTNGYFRNGAKFYDPFGGANLNTVVFDSASAKLSTVNIEYSVTAAAITS